MRRGADCLDTLIGWQALHNNLQSSIRHEPAVAHYLRTLYIRSAMHAAGWNAAMLDGMAKTDEHLVVIP